MGSCGGSAVFKSIRTKYLTLVLCCVVISALLIGGICARNASVNSMQETARNMNLTCESYQHKYDASLKDVQRIVETAAHYGARSLNSIDKFASDEEYRNSYVERLEDVCQLLARDATNVKSYYVRFSPNLLSFEKGFRFTRSGEANKFERVKIVRIQDYQETDEEHVGWYYTPISKGITVWMEPYHNEIFNSDMVTCATPFYKDGELVGVIGMDIDFSTLINDLQELKIFDTGYAFLCDASGKIFYHPLYESGTYIQQDVSGFDARLENESSGEELYRGVSNGQEVEYAFRTLTNDMRLVLRAPVSEINANVTNLIITISALLLGVVVVAVAVTTLISRRITKPLRTLTDAAVKISKGDYDIKLDVKSNDEIGLLARTLQMASVELKGYVERMRQMAFKDSLTGVRNKTAYDIEVDVLKNEIENDIANFGMAIFDINDLKMANDTYGHEQGDKVIKTGCNRICQTFPRSPVFRIGGDEFVVVMRGEDLERVEDRLREFAVRGECENAEVESVQDIVRVAVGVAVYSKAMDTTPQDVFNRADSAMYENKQEMKRKLEQEGAAQEGAPRS